MDIEEIIPEKLKELAALLGGKLYVVGGTCRDALADLYSPVADYDICSPLSAEEVASAAKKAGFTVDAVYKNTGTVRLSCEGNKYEFTSFRTDKYVRGTHTPAEVFFTEDITLDALRRDFKCNAVYYDVAKKKYEDPLGSVGDIDERVINTVTDADKVFGEDGLRLMRVCRIAAQTGFTPTKSCIEGAAKNVKLIKDIAVERVWAELEALLCADLKYNVKDGHYKGLCIMEEIGLIEELLPELYLGKGMEQRSDYHSHDVLEHTFRCVKYAAPPIRLAALLHDVGKPYCKLTTGKFACHETEGERIAADICARLKVSSRLTKRTTELVKWHMYALSEETSEKKIKKFIATHGDILQDLLLLKQADFSACKDDFSVAPCVTRWSKIIEDMKRSGQPTNLKELAVRGDELIAAGIKPEVTGGALTYLLRESAAGNVANEKSALIKLARGMFGKS